MALFDFLRYQGSRVQQPLNLSTPDTPCGQCSGTVKYNMQLDGNCDYTGSRPVNPPSSNPWSTLPNPQPGYTPDSGYLYGQPHPVSPYSTKPIGPSTVPPIVGQFIPKYLNPEQPMVPQYGNPPFPGTHQYPKPCPRYINPRPTYPQPIRPPRPNPPGKPGPGPCYNPCEDTWRNDNQVRQPQINLCASGSMRCPDNPYQPQFFQPHDIPPILKSGKRRDATTPEDICVPDNSPQGYHYEQRPIRPLAPPPNFGQSIFFT